MNFLTNFDFEVILQKEFFGNTTKELLLAVLVFFVVWFIIFIFRKIILRRLEIIIEKTETKLDDRVLKVLQNISGFFWFFVAFFITFKGLNLNEDFEKVLNAIFTFLIVFEVGKLAQELIEFSFEKFSTKKDETALNGIKLVLKISIWVVGALVLLSNLGINITALSASLGIGGIAIALAAQNILGDLFASFTIYFDKPFKVGDYITMGTDGGSVRKIGLKTTRIKTLSGEELIISNKELTEIRLHNFKKLKRRRMEFEFGVVYSTPPKKLEKIPQLIQKIIEKIELCDFLRASFIKFGDSSLDFKVVYFINSNDWSYFSAVQQTINLEILKAFEKEKIAMAFPTRTVYLEK
jgi:small-conductance mechanosensitive channel